MEYEEKKQYLSDLIKKAIKHDEKSFNLLIHEIDDEMYKIAKIKLKNDEDVYEAVQNSIILIYKNLKKLKDTQLFKTWSMRILINECIKIFNKKKKINELYVEYNDENIDYKTESFEKTESKYDMEKLLSKLNENEKIAITLYYDEEFTTNEISNILSESEGTIKSRISRAKLKLKNYIEEEKPYE